MTLVEIYEKYNKISKDYLNFIEELIENNLGGYNQEFIKERLNDFQNYFEEVKMITDKIEVNEDELDNLRDLNYLVVDSLFLALDLAHFYKYNEVERFKMRAFNYLNKKRRNEFF